jgi:nitrate/TMAO reductase-like tetraheme cytochrome c subunit
MLGVLGAVAGWGVTDHLERDNDFCNACHIAEDQPLHAGIRWDFERTPPASLAALHGRESSDGDGEFRCIDCHGGVSWPGSARVKALAAKDAFWYAVGHFEEPDGMRWPLWDEDCSQCHDGFDESEPLGWETPRFHQLPVHNVELGVACVECHRTHSEGDESYHFLSVTWVRTQCARCHTEFEEGSG